MKDWKYILYVAIGVGLFLLIKLTSPKQYDWTVTYHHNDKNPFGGYVLSELLPSILKNGKLEHSYQSLYEIKDSLQKDGNLLIIASSFHCEEPDAKALLSFVAEGGTAFISAQSFYSTLADTLDLETTDYYFKDQDWLSQRDTTFLRFVNPTLDTTRRYGFKKENIHSFFSSFDSTKTTVITRNELGRAVTIQVRWGEGALILNSTPMIFTNIYLLAADNHRFVSSLLSYLPDKNLQWTEFYQLGRMEAATPLRFILSNESLRWAYYLAACTLLAFMIFEMKRRQRVIPIIEPPKNSTLEFVSTIGNLYFQSHDHKNIAEKKIVSLLEQIRSRYFLSTSRFDDDFMESLRLKSGKPRADIDKLINTINRIRGLARIDVNDLVDLNEQIESFYRK